MAADEGSGTHLITNNADGISILFLEVLLSHYNLVRKVEICFKVMYRTPCQALCQQNILDNHGRQCDGTLRLLNMCCIHKVVIRRQK